MLLHDDAPSLLSALLAVLSSELPDFEMQTSLGFLCTNVAV